MGYAARNPKTQEDLEKKGEYWKKRAFDHLIPAVKNMKKDVMEPAMHDLATAGLNTDPIKAAIAKFDIALNEVGAAIQGAKFYTPEEALKDIDVSKIMTGNSHMIAGVKKEAHEQKN